MFDDLDVFFSEFAVDASFTPAGGAEETAKVIFDSPDETVFGERVMTTEYLITLPQSVFVTLKGGDVLNIGSKSYKVREVRLLDDGLIKQASLSKI